MMLPGCFTSLYTELYFFVEEQPPAAADSLQLFAIEHLTHNLPLGHTPLEGNDSGGIQGGPAASARADRPARTHIRDRKHPTAGLNRSDGGTENPNAGGPLFYGGILVPPFLCSSVPPVRSCGSACQPTTDLDVDAQFHHPVQ